jgi:hypothetical protein
MFEKYRYDTLKLTTEDLNSLVKRGIKTVTTELAMIQGSYISKKAYVMSPQ